MKRCLVGVALVGIVGFAMPAPASAIPGHKLKGSSSVGDYAVASFGGNIRAPKFLYVRAIAKPTQEASLNYTITCSKGFNAGSRSGSTSGVNPVLRVKIPFGKGADRCYYGVSGQLQAEGQGITVQLWGKRR